MEKWFALDGKFYSIMTKIGDLLILNFFWLISSLPIITIGASTTALFQITMKMAENREGNIAKEYWKAFIKNLKQTTISWMTFLSMQMLVIIAAVSLRNISNFPGISGIVIGLWIVEIVLILSFAYVFPLQAYKPTQNHFTVWKQALIICIANLPWSIVLTLGEGILLFIIWKYTLQSVPVWLVFGVAAYAYLASFVFLHVFQKSARLLAGITHKN